MAVGALGGPAAAATLPAHDPLTIVVVSDEVNPNGLSDAELTQPGDIRAALAAPDSGLNVASVTEFDSACIDDALTALAAGPDVLVYFAHRSATTCAGGEGQQALTSAIREHLQTSGGIVMFHHGVFSDRGKGPLLSLLGATASTIDWQPAAGQSVIATAGDHFVVTNALDYPQNVSISADALGVPQADYPAFINTPDERYPGLSLLTEGDETRTLLFLSDFDGPQVLGYDLWRPAWARHVVMYQPGEYQPNALDDRTGNNFQVLANAIYYVAHTIEEPSAGDTGADAGDTGADDGTEDDPGDGADEMADDTGRGDGGSSDPGDGDPGEGPGSGGSDGTGGTAGGSDGGDGCGCATPVDRPRPWALATIVIALAGLRRRAVISVGARPRRRLPRSP